MSGPITAVARELARYKLDLLDVQEVWCNERGAVRTGDYFFLLKRKRKSSTGIRNFLYTTE
jgi:hypothetical protein